MITSTADIQANLEKGCPVVVLDPARSHISLLESTEDVEHIQFESATKYNINPLASPDILRNLNAITDDLQQMIMGDGELGAYERAGLRKVITDLHSNLGNRIYITPLAEELATSRDRRIVDLAELLFDYTDKGQYRHIFNAHPPPREYPKFTYVDIEQILPDPRVLPLVLRNMAQRAKCLVRDHGNLMLYIPEHLERQLPIRRLCSMDRVTWNHID